MTAVETALTEVRERKTAFAPQLEGLYDYRRLNILTPTLAYIEQAIQDYERRLAHLSAVEVELVALVGDGHPVLPVREISAEALADLQANLETINAARARFSSDAATGLGLTGGAKTPK